MDCAHELSQNKSCLSQATSFRCFLTAIRKVISMLCYLNLYFVNRKGGGVRDGSQPRAFVKDSVDFRRKSTLTELPPSVWLMEARSREVAFSH